MVPPGISGQLTPETLGCAACLTWVDLAFSCTKSYPSQVKRHSVPFQMEATLKYLVASLTFTHDCTIKHMSDSELRACYTQLLYNYLQDQLKMCCVCVCVGCSGGARGARRCAAGHSSSQLKVTGAAQSAGGRHRALGRGAAVSLSGSTRRLLPLSPRGPEVPCGQLPSLWPPSPASLAPETSLAQL